MELNSISFVIPCLNEHIGLPHVLKKIVELRQTIFKDRDVEIIVSDNGSTDDSVKIALEFGAEVVHCPDRGYGAALQYGIRSAKHEIIVFADADNTYDLLESTGLVTELEKGYDLVLGSRMMGTIYPQAMPFLHRHLGTPILNAIINLLYAKGGTRVTDCNSGFRCFWRVKFTPWNVTSSGMEFASEMLVKALKTGAKLSQVPVSLRPDMRESRTHLLTWRDGMRHLLQILLESPEFFYGTGVIVLAMSWLVLLGGLLFGQITIGFATILGIHSMLFALLGSCLGIAILGVGLELAVKVPTSIRIYRYLIELTEEKLFWQGLLFLLISFFLFSMIIVNWALNGFNFLALERETLALTALGVDGLFLTLNVVTAHLIKRF
jgi:glycosyltransferase involved in cell wall biosynthesis